jgi:hypothetical protein
MLLRAPLGVGDDTLALVWTMVERHEPESAYQPFWASLPQRFGTGECAAQRGLRRGRGCSVVVGGGVRWVPLRRLLGAPAINATPRSPLATAGIMTQA